MHDVTPFSETVTLRNELSLYSSITLSPVSTTIGKNGATCVAITSPPCRCRAVTSSLRPGGVVGFVSWSNRCNANAQCKAKLLFHTWENGIFWLSAPAFDRQPPIHFKLRFKSCPLSWNVSGALWPRNVPPNRVSKLAQ